MYINIYSKRKTLQNPGEHHPFYNQCTEKMAASVKIEFDDGSRVISQTLDDSQDPGGMEHGVPNKDERPATCSVDIFYEVLFMLYCRHSSYRV